MEYYTYAYLREDGTPYYIGKGKNRRAFDRKKHTVFVPSTKRILLLKQNLTEEEAFRHEIYMIGVFGRKDLGTGILHNKTDGGEGSSGYRHTNEYKNTIKQKQLKRWSKEEEKNKIMGDKNPFFGKRHTKETKEKISADSRLRTKGADNGNSKSWKITFENGKDVITDCMSSWCKINSYNYWSVLNVYKNLSKNHKGIVSVIQL